MKKNNNYINYNKQQKFKSLKRSYIFTKKLVIYIICDNFGCNDGIVIKREDSIKI